MDISTEHVDMHNPPIPFRLVVGVTGHRKLKDEKAAAEAVRSVLGQIREKLPEARATPVLFTALSPLAEGADRLVAREVLRLEGSQLEVVLPFGREEYAKGFPDTREEFESLFRQSKRVKQLPGENDRENAYTWVGRYVVDHCDVLIALWDGEPAAGKGGTAEIIEYARDTGCPLFLIDSRNPTEPAKFEAGHGLRAQTVEGLDGYNSEKIGEDKIRAGVTAEYDKLISESQNPESGAKQLHDAYAQELGEVYGKVLPHFVRADLLAGIYQRKYYLAGVLIYSLAAAAVAVAAVQIFESVWWGIPIVEVVLMIGVLLIIQRENKSKWHHKYINYRFLAERFRTELFMSFGNFEYGGLSAPRRRTHASAGEWVTAAFSSIWNELPPVHVPDDAEFAALKRFLCKAWVQNQIGYHDRKCKLNRRRNDLLTKSGTALFALTLLAAGLHLVGNYGHQSGDAAHADKAAARAETNASHAAAPRAAGVAGPGLLGPALHALHEMGHWLIVIAVVAPAVGGALGAIRTHREYHRIAVRHEETSRQLKDLKERIARAENLGALLPLMRETEETMLRESEDWRAAVAAREIEIP